MDKIKIAIAGVGNFASSLLQGIEYYRRHGQLNGEYCGLMHKKIGPYSPGDIEVVAAFDVDGRKVGRPVHEAIFAKPNNTIKIWDDFENPGPVLDGCSEHMLEYNADQSFRPSDAEPVDVVKVLRQSKADILINYLPVGSQQATEFYAEAALQAGTGFVNCIPVFIVSDPDWAERFRSKGIACVGDDIKAQLGATIVHRALKRLFRDRGITLESTYQLNTGGNTDFLNMLNHKRLKSKKISKTEAVQSQLEVPLPDDQVL